MNKTSHDQKNHLMNAHSSRTSKVRIDICSKCSGYTACHATERGQQIRMRALHGETRMLVILKIADHACPCLANATNDQKSRLKLPIWHNTKSINPWKPCTQLKRIRGTQPRRKGSVKLKAIHVYAYIIVFQCEISLLFYKCIYICVYKRT